MGELARRHYGWIVGALMRRFGMDRAVAEDLAQNTFLRVFWHAPGLGRTNVRAWIGRIALNLSLNELRDARRRPRLDEAALATVRDGSPSPLDELILDEDIQSIEREVERVTVEGFAELWQAWKTGRSAAEVAADRGVPAGTLSSRWSRGLAQLRSLPSGPEAEPVTATESLVTLHDADYQRTVYRTRPGAETDVPRDWLLDVRNNVIKGSSPDARQIYEPGPDGWTRYADLNNHELGCWFGHLHETAVDTVKFLSSRPDWIGARTARTEQIYWQKPRSGGPLFWLRLIIERAYAHGCRVRSYVRLHGPHSEGTLSVIKAFEAFVDRVLPRVRALAACGQLPS